MQSTLYNAQLWLGHAEKVRALSKAVNDPRTKQQMLAVAAGFDRIADLAAQLRPANGRPPQNDRRLMSRLAPSAV
jgi:ATP phosphoribosyltransferase regulatory subunit HisZ